MKKGGNLLEQVRASLDKGLSDQAAALARARDTRNIKDAAVHLQWADLLEELGLVDEVVLELNLAIRDDPERSDVYARLSEVYLDQGQPLKASRLWSSCIKKDPANADYYEELGKALEEAKEFEKAREAYQRGLDNTNDGRFSSLLKNLNFMEAPEGPQEPPSQPDQLLPETRHLVTFTSLFAGREGVYARQWVSPTGEYGYTPVEEPLTPKIAENHILGNFTIGTYPVRLDNSVNFIAFDFDLAKFAVRKAISSQKLWESLMGKVHQMACRLLDLGAQYDIPMYLEDSGFKGRHTWIFLETSVPAGVAKKCGDMLVNELLPFPSEVTVEVFPRQGSVPRGGLGNLIKLPLGIHRRTGKRALFIQPEGEPYADQLGFLEQVNKVSRRTVYGIIQRLQAKRQVPAASAESPPWEETSTEETAPFPEPPAPVPALPEIYDLDRDPQFQTIVAKCATLQALVEKINQTSQLSKEETMVLIHTMGHLDRGPEAVNELFHRCANADSTLFLKSRLRGNPMSCPKIQARIPHITSALACNCVFDLGVNLYPTPLIHVRGVASDFFAHPLGKTVDSLQFQNLFQEYLKLRKQLRETQILLEQYEQRLEKFFDEAGVDSVQTALGKLVRTKKEGGETTFTLEI